MSNNKYKKRDKLRLIFQPSFIVKKIIEVKTSSTVELKSNKKVALVAHFDPNGQFDETFLFYLEELRNNSFDIIVITTSDSLEQNSTGKCLKYAHSILRRSNIGLDFASWRCAIEYYNIINNYESLLLTNDSIIGPLFPLKKYLDTFSKKKHTICGLTDSFEKHHHIQSYFLYFNNDLLKSDFFKTFLSTIKVLKNKDMIIRNYEIGLSKLAREENINLYSYVDARNLIIEKENSFNVTLFKWSEIIEKFQFPFIKRELLAKNRLNYNLDEIYNKIDHYQPHLTEIVRSYIMRLKASLVNKS